MRLPQVTSAVLQSSEPSESEKSTSLLSGGQWKMSETCDGDIPCSGAENRVRYAHLRQYMVNSCNRQEMYDLKYGPIPTFVGRRYKSRNRPILQAVHLLSIATVGRTCYPRCANFPKVENTRPPLNIFLSTTVWVYSCPVHVVWAVCAQSGHQLAA